MARVGRCRDQRKEKAETRASLLFLWDPAAAYPPMPVAAAKRLHLFAYQESISGSLMDSWHAGFARLLSRA